MRGFSVSIQVAAPMAVTNAPHIECAAKRHHLNLRCSETKLTRSLQEKLQNSSVDILRDN